MFGSQVLEVLIGLTLTYLVLSIGCSGIKEVIAAVLSLRAKTLEKGIRNMLKNGANDYTAQLFSHPLIAGTAPAGEKPSYISARLFASALFDIVAPSDPGQPRTIQSLRAGVAQIPDAKLRTLLLNSIDTAGGDIDRAREKVEHWFDDTMQRVSGWYKRLAQKIIFGVGLLLCVLINADAVMILKELWNDQALRSATVAEATQKVQAANATSSAAQQDALQQAIQDIHSFQTLPIGWSSNKQDIRAMPAEFSGGALKALGILLSSFAIVLGAPFWFDMLNNLINLRSSGNPPVSH
jgi:hypothetical protein